MGSLNRLQELGRRIAEEQDGLLRGSGLFEQIRPTVSRMRPLMRRGPRMQAGRTAIALAAAFLCGLAGVWLLQSKRSLQFEIGIRPEAGRVGAWISASRREPLPVHFSDGTELVLMAGSRGRVAQTTPHGARVVLESGQASFAAPHRNGAQWELSTGPFVVTVTGTRFFIGWDPARDVFELRVQQGSVKVTGCVFGDSGRSVLAGEMLRASCDAATFAIAKAGVTREMEDPRHNDATVSTPEPSVATEEVAAEVGRKANTQPARATGQNWVDLAGAGQYVAALQAAEAAGYDRQCATLNGPDLARLGDVARFAGRLDLARKAYFAIRSRFPGTERAAIAAFTLGRMDQDQEGAHAVAARWYRTCLTERPGGALAREAMGRLMEALHRAGDRDGAQRVAAQYVKRHPRGPHAALAEQLLRVGRTGPGDR